MFKYMYIFSYKNAYRHMSVGGKKENQNKLAICTRRAKFPKSRGEFQEV